MSVSPEAVFPILAVQPFLERMTNRFQTAASLEPKHLVVSPEYKLRGSVTPPMTALWTWHIQ